MTRELMTQPVMRARMPRCATNMPPDVAPFAVEVQRWPQLIQAAAWIVRFGCDSGSVDFVSKGVDEFGHALVAAYAVPKGSLGLEHPRGDPAFLHGAILPLGHPRRPSAWAIEIIDSMQFVLVSVLVSVPRMPRRVTVNISSSPSRKEAAASGGLGLELFGQSPRRVEFLGRIGLGEDEGQALVDGAGQLLGQVTGLISALVQCAALHHGVVAEDLLDARGECLGAVDDAEHTAVDRETRGV